MDKPAHAGKPAAASPGNVRAALPSGGSARNCTANSRSFLPELLRPGRGRCVRGPGDTPSHERPVGYQSNEETDNTLMENNYCCEGGKRLREVIREGPAEDQGRLMWFEGWPLGSGG